MQTHLLNNRLRDLLAQRAHLVRAGLVLYQDLLRAGYDEPALYDFLLALDYYGHQSDSGPERRQLHHTA